MSATVDVPYSMEKVLKDRRSPRRRGRMWTSVTTVDVPYSMEAYLHLVDVRVLFRAVAQPQRLAVERDPGPPVPHERAYVRVRFPVRGRQHVLVVLAEQPERARLVQAVQVREVVRLERPDVDSRGGVERRQKRS